jgi:hypothetical protein
MVIQQGIISRLTHSTGHYFKAYPFNRALLPVTRKIIFKACPFVRALFPVTRK